MKIKKTAALILAMILTVTMLPGTVFAATTFTPQSASGSYPIPARQYYCYLSGTSEYFHAEMTYTNASPLIEFSVYATVLLAPGEKQDVFVMSEYGQESISKTESLSSTYLSQGFYATKGTGWYYVGANNVANLTIH